MRQYEVTFIIDPVLSGDEIKQAAKAYQKLLKDDKCNIINIDDIGLKPLAYPIKRRNSGIYQCIEFTTESGESIPKMELAMRRDERIMRFLTIKLDKYGVKYNEDKRNGLIGKRTNDSKDKGTQEGGKKNYQPKDDLTLIHGVDPKTAKLLKTSGINTYALLASKSPEEISQVLKKGGSNYTNNDPSGWAAQAQLAADGKWSELNAHKEKLMNPSSSEEE